MMRLATLHPPARKNLRLKLAAMPSPLYHILYFSFYLSLPESANIV
jgi:hypothetical protein